jgi:hypothetical protein
MLVFLDFEASSLSNQSYPVEVAWVFEDGCSRSFLIRPAPDWTDWSSEAEAIHGISRELLEKEGVAVSLIAEEMVETLSNHDLYASAPSWDGKWLSALLRAAGHPRHALRLQKCDEAFVAVAGAVFGKSISEAEMVRLVNEVIERTEPASPAHRALPDALLELERWKRVREEAQARSGYQGQPFQ